MVNKSWQQGTALAAGHRDHRDGGTVRVYQGHPRHPTVTELPPRNRSPPRRQKTNTPYQRHPSPQARYRASSPTPMQRREREPAPVQHRSPSPQKRYADRRGQEAVDETRRVTHDNPYDKSFAQSQKQMQQSRLEEQVSALSYEVVTLKAELKKLSQQAENASQRSGRMENDQLALKQERDAAIAQAEVANEELRLVKESADSKAVIKLQEELEMRKQVEGELRASLATALSDREDALRLANQSTGIMTGEEFSERQPLHSAGVSLSLSAAGGVSATVESP
eukprot:TRINITY_DN6786_c0_g1_i1.p1 TRINITY_DN6786_c0_g1~~TRINITY_DN6786_c0_g1_i1.p1  ORF type:complete len:281 (-),score=66.75 TRINITY_DN6786_c0_g1_i1:276-1118(-)